MLCDWYLILSFSFPLRHIKHSNISHSFFWCIICYWNLTAPLVVAASWITLLCVTTSLWNTSVCSRGWDKQHLWLLLEGVIPGAFPVVSGKQTAIHREAGQVVDSTDPCEESKERKSTKTLVARAGSATLDLYGGAQNICIFFILCEYSQQHRELWRRALGEQEGGRAKGKGSCFCWGPGVPIFNSTF